MAQLNALVEQMQVSGDRNADVFTLIESRLFEKRLEARLTAERTIDAQERWEHRQKQMGE